MIKSGIILLKIWLEVGADEQKRRFEARIEDPLRQWKLSATDLYSRSKWYEYSQARDAMLKATDTRQAPWYIVHSDDKKRARLNVLAHILSKIPTRGQARGQNCPRPSTSTPTTTWPPSGQALRGRY
jgi:polyphosphate kinase 2 (PPK2 family)